MKINDIIFEAINSWQDMEQEVIQDISNRTGQRQPKYMRLNTQKAAQDAFVLHSRGMAQSDAIRQAFSMQGFDEPRSNKPQVDKPQPDKPKADDSDSTRQRKDRLGRRLQHDRYYNQKDQTTPKDKPEEPTDFVNDPDSILPEPVQKTIHNVKKGAKKAKANIDLGREISKKFIDFDR